MDNDKELHQMNASNTLIPYVADQRTQLGEKYDIPFTVTNMQAAKLHMDSMQIAPPSPINIRTTHKYIKFFPQNTEDIDALESVDNRVYFSEEPLEYERIVQGGYYREPNISDTAQTPLYASVPANFVIPNGINYSLLAELYIPDEDSLFIGNNPSLATWDYINDLTYFAHDRIGHEDRDYFTPHTGPYIEGGGGPSFHGIISVFDTRLSAEVPLEGVTVKAVKHRGFGVASLRYGVTNSAGQYALSGIQTKGSTNYIVLFETPNFAIHRSTVAAFTDFIGTCARSQFPDRSRTHFSHTFSHTGGDQYDNMIANMFRASYRYYYGNVDGLKRPIRDGVRQRLVAINGFIDPNRPREYGSTYVGFPVLKVGRHNDMHINFDSDEYYGLTIHELAHVAHELTMINPVQFHYDVDDFIAESWAVACQWYLTCLEYRSRGISNYGSESYYISNQIAPHNYAYQYWRNEIHPDYTSLFINLVDDYNEFDIWFEGERFGTVNDNVSGYNLSTIQSNYLKDIYSSSSLSTQLKANKPSGVTNTQIDNLLSHY